MPTRDYTIVYKIDDSDWNAKMPRIIADLRQADQLVDQLKAKSATLFSGAGRTMSAFTGQVQKGTAELKDLDAELAKASAGFQNLGTAASGASTGLRSA